LLAFKGYQEQLTRYKELNNALLAANANHKSALDKKSELEEQDKTHGFCQRLFHPPLI
jgi:hypothetical protein